MPEENQIKELNNIAKKLSDKYDLDGRYLIRNSGTEPLLRVLIEANDSNSVNEFSDELINNIKNYLFT
jgi:phosphomannomutase